MGRRLSGSGEAPSEEDRRRVRVRINAYLAAGVDQDDAWERVRRENDQMELEASAQRAAE